MFDVCLVTEGTYPRTIGGVSSWTHDHLRALPELRFSVVHLGDEGEGAASPRYRPPAHTALLELELDPERDEPAPGVAECLPEARVYHSLATGAAGAVAARAAVTRGRPFLLTEHGLAWHEAALGITACKPTRTPAPGVPHERIAAAVREMARASYRDADVVTSVCAANRSLQRRAGAPAERLRLTPNAAVSLDASEPHVAGPLRIGFVGRVVRVKDVETFVRACALAAGELPAAEFVVIGPLDHEPAYVERCHELATELGLGERLRFCGERDPATAPERLDLLVLTSLSEAQPRSALEAMAAGVPVVATDVGGCAELVHGLDAADRATGPAGLLTPVRSPRATADAIVSLARDPARRARLGAAGRRRVASRYAPARVQAGWRELYGRWLEDRR